MSCKTCNDRGVVKQGNAYEQCPDCCIEISTMKNNNTLEAQILFALILIAAMFSPNVGRAQTRRNQAHYISGNSTWIGVDTVGNGGVKKDTISMDVLCTKILGSSNDALVVTRENDRYVFPYIFSASQERTLEWQTVTLPPPSKNGLSLSICITEQKWVTTETRWLDSVEGCYQLVSLEGK